MPRPYRPKPKPKLGIIHCLLCQTPLMASGRRVSLLNAGNRIVCKQCEKTVRKARTLFSSILGRPFREMISMARMIEKQAVKMIDGPEIRLLAQLDTPVYRDIVAEWSRITGCRVDPLPRQVWIPPAGDESQEPSDGA